MERIQKPISEILPAMQISAANLLASQSQAVRPRATTAAFEPIAFRQTPAASVSVATTSPEPGPGAAPTTAAPAPAASSEVAPSFAARSGYVRPGSQIDIKI